METETKTIEATKPFDSSDSVKDLFGALCKAQSDMGGAKKDSDNPYFKSKYADLHSCWQAIREPLAKNGLSIVQIPHGGVSTVKVTTVLGHTSGQWISSVVEVKPTKTDPQGTGSAMTYARRYGLMSIAGIAPEDDDGNSASQPTPRQAPPQVPQTTLDKSNTQVSMAQIKRLMTIVGTTELSHEQVKEIIKAKYNLTSSKNLNIKQYEELVKLIENQTYEEVML